MIALEHDRAGLRLVAVERAARDALDQDVVVLRLADTPGRKLMDWQIAAAIGELLGAVGVIELAFFMSTLPTADTIMKHFCLHLDAASIWPWAVIAVVLAIGFAACRHTYPPMSASYNTAIAEVKTRMAP